jgi:hypothetical protein
MSRGRRRNNCQESPYCSLLCGLTQACVLPAKHPKPNGAPSQGFIGKVTSGTMPSKTVPLQIEGKLAIVLPITGMM